MKRRQFFGAATAVAATGLAMPANAQGNITWRMVTTWPKNFPGLGVGAQNIADRITKASGGRLTVQVFAAGEMVPGLGALDAVAAKHGATPAQVALAWLLAQPAIGAPMPKPRKGLCQRMAPVIGSRQ